MKTAIEEIEEQLNHSRVLMNNLKADQQKLIHDIRYYEGQCDALNNVLAELKKSRTV